MQIIRCAIIYLLVIITIYQSMQIGRLKRQTIEAFKKLCEKVFERVEDDYR